MDFNAMQQYRPSPTGSFPSGQSSPAPGSQMMYPYGSLPPQEQSQQPTSAQQMSKPSPPQPSWAIPHTQGPYYPMPRGPVAGSREESGHLLAGMDATSQAPAYSSANFSNSMHTPRTLATTDYYSNPMDHGPWGQKLCGELETFPSLDPDVTDFSQGMMGQDENTPIIDLRQYHGMVPPDSDHLTPFQPPQSARRLSESSFSMSSTGGGLPETTYEDLGSSEAVSYASEYDAWNHSEQPGPRLLSPIASPRRPQHEGVVRGGSRSRVSPAPHNNVRSSPYTLDSNRNKRWSTGQAPTSTPTSSSGQTPDRFTGYGPRMNPHHSMPSFPPSAYANFAVPTQNVLYSQNNHIMQQGSPAMFVPPEQAYHLEIPRPLPSQGLFRLLQSNADRHGGCSSHFADLSDPPDLYSSLQEEASNPPESDMNPSDPDLVPHEQDVRFVGDLYTPRWVRGHGNKREGWCGLCKPGRWLVLKNSAFWYDKSFTHGVSAATGAAFQGPQETRRTEGNLDVWEGLCGSCGEWIALVSSKKKGTTWFRHAYKCHTHPKVKDGPKRRRETQAGRVRATSSASSSSSYPIKHEVAQDVVSQRHSTPTPIPGSAGLQSFSMPKSTPPNPLSASTPTALLGYPGSAAYATPTSTPGSMHPLQTPTQGTFPHSHNNKHDSVMSMFAPMQGMPNFSGTPPSFSKPPSLALQVSEPELVGVRTTMTTLNSIASMI